MNNTNAYPKKIDETVLIFGLNIFSSSTRRLLALTLPEKIKNRTNLTQFVSIFTPNPEQIVLAEDSPGYNRSLKQADYLIPDGIGLISAHRVLKWFGKAEGTIQERITGMDLSAEFLETAKNSNLKVLLIGGKDYDTAQYKQYRVQKLNHAYLSDFVSKLPDSSIQKSELNNSYKPLFWLEGYLDINNPTKVEQQLIEESIKTLQPDIVFVAFGAPKQENWVNEHRKLLSSSNVKVALVVGGAFDVLLGKLKRAPRLIRSIGLEWLFRLLQEPHRWRRQLKLLKFIQLVGKEVLRK